NVLSNTLQYRPVVLTMACIVILLIIPFYMFSTKELAPVEDQGVVFGIVQSSADATLDQTWLFAEKIYDVFSSFPESNSIFEVINPKMGFSGMMVKPWNPRKRSAQDLQMLASAEFAKI